MRKHRFSWRQFLRHFTLGGVLGTFSGLLLWLIATPWSYTQPGAGLACVMVMSVTCGLLAGWKREKFWENAFGWLLLW